MINVAVDRIQGLLDLGGPVVAILMVMSVLAAAVVLWKLVVFEIEGIGRGTSRGFLYHTLEEARAGGIAREAVRERLYARLEAEFGRAAAGLRVLDVTAQIAPLLGLFGTVLGMIAAFRTLQEAGSTADPSVLAGGIWVALMTTAAGLVVAMPSSLLLSWFDGRLDTHRRIANEAVEEFLTPQVFPAEQSDKVGSLAHAH
jgi:biopolymer transport protein ExbB